MNTISAKLTQIKINGENPRSITNDKLNKLVNSILVFPKMLSIRPIVVDDKMVALGGNMRLNALKIIVKMSPEELGTRLATIPDYLKKSAGERENIARHWEAWLKSPVVEIIKATGPRMSREAIRFDEFTSVVDRNIAQISSLAIQKAIRRKDAKFIAVTCHYDVQEWLMPDWVFNTDDMSFKVFSKDEQIKKNFTLKSSKPKTSNIIGAFLGDIII